MRVVVYGDFLQCTRPCVDKTKGQSPFGPFGQETTTTKDTFANNPNALSPAQIIGAYNFPTAKPNGPQPGTGETIAIVDAYDDPNIASDLSTFDTQFGLPQLPSCTVTATSQCFQKVSETGTAVYPPFDQGWSAEISLDVEWAHAIAPGANILLVEATTATTTDLVRAIAYASTRAQYVSMSWGGPETSATRRTTSPSPRQPTATSRLRVTLVLVPSGRQPRLMSYRWEVLR